MKTLDEKVAGLLEQGLTDRQICAQVGIDRKRVSGARSRLNVGPGANVWMRDALLGSHALLHALRKHHPDRCSA
jgi:hypothetical protein